MLDRRGQIEVEPAAPGAAATAGRAKMIAARILRIVEAALHPCSFDPPTALLPDGRVVNLAFISMDS